MFVDINQEGEPVKRFDVVKAIGRDNPLLECVFDLLAREETRQRDVFYKPKASEFTFVLKSLSQISKIPDGNAKVDRMWERMLEIVSFVRTKKHRQPSEILKSFIKSREQRDARPEPKISAPEMRELRRIFRFLRNVYKKGLGSTPLATDQTHFYTMTTTIISDDMFETYEPDEFTRETVKAWKIVAESTKVRKTGKEGS